MIDLYPTLIDLCGLPEKKLDGRSFAPLLTDADQAWPPSLTVFGSGNASVNDERFHYIRYIDGTEEFYDRNSDPMEWNNLMSKLSPEQLAEKNRLAKLVPDSIAEPLAASDSKAFKKLRNLNDKIKPARKLESLK